MVTLEDCLAAFFAADELKGNRTIFDISECAIMNVTEKGKKKKRKIIFNFFHTVVVLGNI